MAKFAVVVLLALAAVASAVPIGIGGGVVSKNHHVSTSSHIITPHIGGLGLGYGLLGYPGGLIGKSISTHHSSIGHHHIIPYGLGLGGIGLKGLELKGLGGGLGGLGGLGGFGLGGLYPGNVGIGYGLLG